MFCDFDYSFNVADTKHTHQFHVKTLYMPMYLSRSDVEGPNPNIRQSFEPIRQGLMLAINNEGMVCYQPETGEVYLFVRC